MSTPNQAEPQRLPVNPRSATARRRPELGTGRLGIISGYFQLSGIGAAIQTLMLAAATLFPKALRWQGPRPFAMLAVAALLTFGFLRTNHLLDQRRRSGAQLATLCFLTSLAGAFARGWSSSTLISVGISALGLGLVASVWKHLEND
jgi:hypothetical protein